MLRHSSSSAAASGSSSATQPGPVTPAAEAAAPDSTVSLAQALAELNNLVSVEKRYGEGQWVAGSSLDLEKLGVKGITREAQQTMSMAVLRLRCTSHQSHFERGDLTLAYLKKLYAETTDPFNDANCKQQLDFLFQQNPCYYHLRRLGIKLVALPSGAGGASDPAKFTSVLAVIDNQALIARFAAIQQRIMKYKAFLIAQFSCSQSGMENAVTMLNSHLLRESANCKGAWKLGNCFLRNGEVALSLALQEKTFSRPMARLKLRYAPKDANRRDIKDVYASLRQATHPEINADAREFKLYQLVHLDAHFEQNPYYRFLKKVGIRFIVDLDNVDASSAADLFIPVRIIVNTPEVIRQLAKDCESAITNSQDSSLNRKRSFLINLAAVLADEKWDELGWRSTRVGVLKYPPTHIRLMRADLQRYNLDKDENVTKLFDLIKTTIMSISFPELTSQSSFPASADKTSNRKREVTNLYLQLRQDVMAVAGLNNSELVPEADSSTHSM